MRGGCKKMLYKILLTRRYTGYTASASALRTVGIDRHTLNISVMRHRNDTLLFIDKVIHVKLVKYHLDIGAAAIAVFVLYLDKVVLDYLKHSALVGKYRLKFRNFQL